jgi:hypothetical protein
MQYNIYKEIVQHAQLPNCSTSILADGEQNGTFAGQNEGCSAFSQKFFIRATVHFTCPVVSGKNKETF